MLVKVSEDFLSPLTCAHPVTHIVHKTLVCPLEFVEPRTMIHNAQNS